MFYIPSYVTLYPRLFINFLRIIWKLAILLIGSVEIKFSSIDILLCMPQSKNFISPCQIRKLTSFPNNL